LREKYRLRVIENRVLGKIFGPKRDDEKREWRRLLMKIFMIYNLHHILFGGSDQEE
jgi:hypothetical protein